MSMLASLTIAQHMAHRMFLALLLCFVLGTGHSCASGIKFSPSAEFSPKVLLGWDRCRGPCAGTEGGVGEESMSQQQWLSP